MNTNEQVRPFRDFQPQHFRWETSADGKVATLTLDRPERKNPLTFEAPT
jgi:enoyl-CoA hydratase/carnithine racemase